MERDGLQEFMRQSSHRILTRDEELQLARRKDVDKEAFDKLVTHNVRLVYSIARRYANGSVPLDDLIQEGMLGLIHAVEKFDPERGFKLSTYATWWIRQVIDRCIHQKDRTIRLPQQVAHEVAAVVRAERKLRGSLGREPSTEEVAAQAKLTAARVVDLRRFAMPVLSTDVGTELDGAELPTDTIPDLNVQIEDDVVLATEAERLRTAIAKLPDKRAQRILELRYGLDGEGERTLDQVGRELGITRERVRQLQNLALKDMRAVWAA